MPKGVEMGPMSLLKQKLQNNEKTVGSWIGLAHPGLVEMMADAGFDWLTIDLEHTVITIKEAADLIRIIDLKGVSPLVRLISNDQNQIKQVMDAGAHGVIVPMIKNAEQARQAVDAVKYPPVGSRGVGLGRAQKYGFGFEEYVQSINENSVVIAQIEHIEAIENLDEILDVPGIDGTIIGPYDLSGSMGKPGRYEDQDVSEALKRYEEICQKKNKPMGYHVIKPNSELIVEKINAGYKFLAFSTDYLFFGHSVHGQMQKLKEVFS